MKILISNDDGVLAPGIACLINEAKAFGELTIVAPDSPQSAMGHAITIGRPIRVKEVMLPGDIPAYACSGTPADCVKIGTGVLMKEMPDLVLSGINHGSNTSVSAIYSGTLSAAREGAIQNIPSIGFSLLEFSHKADMSGAAMAVRKLLEDFVRNPLRPGQLLNVNIPYLAPDEIKGFKITSQAKGRWTEEFDERTDPFGRKYYWLTGSYDRQDERTDTDEYVLAEGYVSVTPMMHDLTAYGEMEGFAGWLS